ncbi:pepsin-like aspartic protease [Aspergillus undulatus]|uniref:pepsin-like aspartic protease n=1 Tax=Aspergillus undulatus TaxID=1810928 RepID=UPI003CCDDC38
MRSSFLSLLAAVAVVPGLCSLSLRESDEPHVLRLGLKRNRHDDPVGRDRRRFKRQTVNVELSGDSHGGEIYSTNLTIGDPPQRVEVTVDTGSSDLWVLSTYNRVCEAQGARCDSLGTYDPMTSDSSDPLSHRFSIVYGDISWAEGYYAIDTLTIEDAELPEVQFGVAMSSSIDKGILGIGYTTNVASGYPYPNLPALLVANNITSSNAYSLWLNRLGSDEGTILFGGVNTAHYTGELQTLPVVPLEGDTYVHLWLTLTELGVESEADDVTEAFNSDPLVVLLDSGATLTYLPADLVLQIYSALDVHFFEPEQFGYVPCDTYLSGREDYSLTFTFSGLTIRVPLHELILRDTLWYAGDMLDVEDEESCIFGILPAADFFPILGDSFLRSAYVVFDLDNNEISMAQANFEPGDDHILEIGEGDDSVPEAKDVEGPVETAPVVTDGTSLVLPSGFTNEPVFPTRTVTTSVQAETTVNSDPSVPSDVDDEETNGGDSSEDGEGTAAAPEETGTDGAALIRWDPLLIVLAMGLAGISLIS